MTTTTDTTTITTVTLTEKQALALTDKINKKANELCWLVEEAHDKEAWRTLGHADFKEYVTARLVISEQHAYRLLDQARVNRELETAAGIEHSTHTRVSHRAVQAIKPQSTMNRATAAIRERVDAGESPDQAIATVVEREVKDFVEKKAATKTDADSLAAKINKALDKLIALLGDGEDFETRLALETNTAKAMQVRYVLDKVLTVQVRDEQESGPR
jgi:hypothetical protein